MFVKFKVICLKSKLLILVNVGKIILYVYTLKILESNFSGKFSILTICNWLRFRAKYVDYSLSPPYTHTQIVGSYIYYFFFLISCFKILIDIHLRAQGVQGG